MRKRFNYPNASLCRACLRVCLIGPGTVPHMPDAESLCLKIRLSRFKTGGREGASCCTKRGFYIVVRFFLVVFTCEAVTEEATEVRSEARLCERE